MTKMWCKKNENRFRPRFFQHIIETRDEFKYKLRSRHPHVFFKFSCSKKIYTIHSKTAAKELSYYSIRCRSAYLLEMDSANDVKTLSNSSPFLELRRSQNPLLTITSFVTIVNGSYSCKALHLRCVKGFGLSL